jgi:hypothetical protein
LQRPGIPIRFADATLRIGEALNGRTAGITQRTTRVPSFGLSGKCSGGPKFAV